MVFLKENFSWYVWDIRAREDDEWLMYFDFLYTHLFEMQQISNDRVIYHLERLGDDIEREIEHTSFF